MAIQEPTVTNLLIDSLSTRQKKRFLKLCTQIELDFDSVVCEFNQTYQYVYFPLTGFISLIALEVDLPPLEVGLIGNEGMLGVDVVLGVTIAPLQSIVQGSGTALRIPLEKFQQELKADPGLVILLNRYIHVSMQQLIQMAVCIHFHEIEARLARWLLMTNDRAHKNSFRLTHAFLAKMLGVRRSAVSIAANALRKKKLIAYSRGQIEILDRKGLESASCSCYSTMKRYYEAALIS